MRKVRGFILVFLVVGLFLLVMGGCQKQKTSSQVQDTEAIDNALQENQDINDLNQDAQQLGDDLTTLNEIEVTTTTATTLTDNDLQQLEDQLQELDDLNLEDNVTVDLP